MLLALHMNGVLIDLNTERCCVHCQGLSFKPLCPLKYLGFCWLVGCYHDKLEILPIFWLVSSVAATTWNSQLSFDFCYWLSVAMATWKRLSTCSFPPSGHPQDFSGSVGWPLGREPAFSCPPFGLQPVLQPFCTQGSCSKHLTCSFPPHKK